MNSLKKTQKLILIVGIPVLIILFVAYLKIHMMSPYSSLNEIKSKDTLVQQSDEYYVYYYKKNCPYCFKIQDSIFKFASKYKLYIVDTEKMSNQLLKYDWNNFHEQNDIEIGIQNADGTKQFYNNQTEEKYLNTKEKNQFGKLKIYEIIVADKKYLSTNKKAEIGHIYASLQTPEIDYENITDSSAIIIAGVPTLLHIKSGQINGFYFDSPEIAEHINNLLKE
jgi:thiol-disulfide isomerase/thioredoxin